MKKLLIMLIALGSGLSNAGENVSGDSDVCVASYVHDISYGSTMYYNVICGSGEFRTNPNITAVLLPIPYKWSGVAYDRLSREMKKRGYRLKGILRPGSSLPQGSLSGNDHSVFVFDQNSKRNEYCTVLMSSEQSSGIETREKVFNVLISCENDKEETYSGVKLSELHKHLKTNGYQFVFQKTLKGKSRLGYFDSLMLFKK